MRNMIDERAHRMVGGWPTRPTPDGTGYVEE